MNPNTKDLSSGLDAGETVETVNQRAISTGLPVLLESHATFIEAALSHYDGGPASADVREAWAFIVQALRTGERLRGALEDVANPVGYLRRYAEARGTTLNGDAYRIGNDLAFVQKIARDALSPPMILEPSVVGE